MSLPALALTLVRALPFSPALVLIRTITILYLFVRADYRAEIKRNARLVLRQARRLFWVRNGWRVGRNLAVMTRIGKRLGNSVVDKAWIRAENTAQRVLERELHVVMASFHFGAWEYLPQVYSRRGSRVGVVVSVQKDNLLDKNLSRMRVQAGVQLMRSLALLSRHMSRPGVTGVLLDNTSQGGEEWVSVDGILFRVPVLGFRLAERAGLAVIPVFAWLERGRLRIREYPAGTPRQTMAALLEQVRLRPEDWVWWGKADAIRPGRVEAA